MTTTKRLTAVQRREQTTKRTAVAALAFGALVSVAANVAAAHPTALARVVSTWPAVALLLSVHLYQYAPRTFWVKAAVLAVAGVAGWVSYWHIVTVALRAGEGTVTAHLLPITVDAMMGVATVVLEHKPKPKRKPARRTAKAQPTKLRSVA